MGDIGEKDADTFDVEPLAAPVEIPVPVVEPEPEPEKVPA